VSRRPLVASATDSSLGHGASEGHGGPIELSEEMLVELAGHIAEMVTLTPFPPLVDAADAARLLSVPKSWVLAEAKAGRIPHVRLGHYVRFDPAVLRDWWQARLSGPVAGSHPVSVRREAA
jgi:excisionase family DNA binding protein